MRSAVVSFIAAFAFSNAAFAQSPAANPTGSAGNPKQPANAVETRAKGGDAQGHTGARPQSRRDVNVNVRMRSGNVAMQRRTRHRVIVSENRQPDVVVIKKKKRFVKRNRIAVSGAPESRTTVVRHRRAPTVVNQRVHTRTSIRTKVSQKPATNVRVRTNVQGGTTGAGNNSQGQIKAKPSGRGEGNR
jgi:hypothetical protein